MADEEQQEVLVPELAEQPALVVLQIGRRAVGDDGEGVTLIAEAEAPMAIKLGYFGLVCAGVIALTIGVVVFSRPLTALLDRLSGERS